MPPKSRRRSHMHFHSHISAWHIHGTSLCILHIHSNKRHAHNSYSFLHPNSELRASSSELRWWPPISGWRASAAQWPKLILVISSSQVQVSSGMRTQLAWQTMTLPAEWGEGLLGEGMRSGNGFSRKTRDETFRNRRPWVAMSRLRADKEPKVS